MKRVRFFCENVHASNLYVLLLILNAKESIIVYMFFDYDIGE